ncbi:MAG TPA: signal peptidase I [Candidatus Paceibacterota bacterium]
MKNFLVSLFEILEIVAIAMVTVFLVRAFLLQPFLVNGASMEPNFSSGDYLLIDELTYRLRAPERGEVIVFRYPGDETTFYIKRVIGLPGERLKLSKDGIIIFNKEYPDGFTLDEAYIKTNNSEYGDREFILTNSQYFVMGDNRVHSFDSRNWGPMDKKELIGLVRLRLWPVPKISIFEEPAYKL